MPLLIYAAGWWLAGLFTGALLGPWATRPAWLAGIMLLASGASPRTAANNGATALSCATASMSRSVSQISTSAVGNRSASAAASAPVPPPRSSTRPPDAGRPSASKSSWTRSHRGIRGDEFADQVVVFGHAELEVTGNSGRHGGPNLPGPRRAASPALRDYRPKRPPLFPFANGLQCDLLTPPPVNELSSTAAAPIPNVLAER